MALCVWGGIGLGVLRCKCDSVELVRPLCTQQCNRKYLQVTDGTLGSRVGDPDPLVRGTDQDPFIIKQK